MIMDSDVILYHGSVDNVTTPDLKISRDGKDFGKGFYLTTSKEEAKKFAAFSIHKAIHYGIISGDQPTGYISRYKLHASDSLTTYEFEGTDLDWLECIAGYRRKQQDEIDMEKWDSFDMIAGKCVHETASIVINGYLDHSSVTCYGDDVYGRTSPNKSDPKYPLYVKYLKPKKIADQVCIKTEPALGMLEYLGSEPFDLRTAKINIALHHTIDTTKREMLDLARMVIRDRARKNKIPEMIVEPLFRGSKTYAALQDARTRLCVNGPDYISNEYDLELAGRMQPISKHLPIPGKLNKKTVD